MRRLMRSLFVLSLAAAPLAQAGTQPPSADPAATASSTSESVADVSASQKPAEVGLLRTQVGDLETTLKGVRQELWRIREEEDARARVIGDPNVHPGWP